MDEHLSGIIHSDILHIVSISLIYTYTYWQSKVKQNEVHPRKTKLFFSPLESWEDKGGLCVTLGRVQGTDLVQRYH